MLPTRFLVLNGEVPSMTFWQGFNFARDNTGKGESRLALLTFRIVVVLLLKYA